MKTLRDGTKQSTRRDCFHNAPVLEIDGAVLDDVVDDENDPLPIPEYIFRGRARLVYVGGILLRL